MVTRSFIRDERGSTIPLFGICIFAIFAAAGAAIDYTRAATARTEMQAALDAAAITLSKEADQLNSAQLAQRAQAIFEASFKDPEAKKIKVQPTYTNVNGTYKLVMQATGSLDTTVFYIFGRNTIDIKADTEVQWGMRRLELALALDNTGSMAQLGKIDALKSATHSLIDTLKAASKKKTTSASRSSRSRRSSMSIPRRTRRQAGSTSPAGPKTRAPATRAASPPIGSIPGVARNGLAASRIETSLMIHKIPPRAAPAPNFPRRIAQVRYR